MTLRAAVLCAVLAGGGALVGACDDGGTSQFPGGSSDGSASASECQARGASPIPQGGLCPSGSGLAFGVPDAPACCFPCKAPDTVVDNRCVPPSAVDCKKAGGACSEGFNCMFGFTTMGNCNGDVSFARVMSPCCVPLPDAGPADAAGGG